MWRCMRFVVVIVVVVVFVVVVVDDLRVHSHSRRRLRSSFVPDTLLVFSVFPPTCSYSKSLLWFACCASLPAYLLRLSLVTSQLLRNTQQRQWGYCRGTVLDPNPTRTAERKKPKSLSPTRGRKSGPSANPTGSRSPRTRAGVYSEEHQDAGLSAAPAARREGSKDAGGGGVAPGVGAGAGVTLEQILMHNFHNNRVEGLRRTVSGEKGSQVSVRCVLMCRVVVLGFSSTFASWFSCSKNVLLAIMRKQGAASRHFVFL